MKKSKATILISFIILTIMMMSCAAIVKIDRITLKDRKSVKSAKDIELYFTKKAIPQKYTVVSHYSVTTQYANNLDLLKKLKKQASKDGCDAILVESTSEMANSFISWIFLFIPISNHLKFYNFVGISYIN